MKKVIVSVINDLATDQRVHRTCNTLHESNYDVLLVGRRLKTSPKLSPRSYKTYRMYLIFSKGPLFYAAYNLRLFFFLLFKKADVLHSNDLDTLLANYIVSRIKKIPLVFDSHEYFTEVPELEHNVFAKKVWKKIEQFIVPQLSYCITVNQSIADLFEKEYHKKFKVIRNVPLMNFNINPKSRKELGIPENKTILILQGSGINIHRGSEELVTSMSLLGENYRLYIIGGGDVIDTLKKMVIELKITEKVIFLPRQPYETMMQYTMNADAGLTLDKDTNINYRFSLPNKIFDYIHAGIPVISSDLTELKRIINEYQIGEIIPEVTPEKIAECIEHYFSSEEKPKIHKLNTKSAAADLNWQNEKSVLLNIYNSISLKD